MKINCLSCGHKLELDDAYDEYEGQIRCLVCEALLAIKTEAGHVKKVDLNKPQGAPPVGESSVLTGR